MRFLLAVILIYTLSLGDDVTRSLSKDHPFYESSLGIMQLNKVLEELKLSIGEIPPDVRSMALYKIKTDPRDFSPGLARFIQGRIETILRDDGRRTIVSPPELKTIKILSTDTSFQISNTLPNVEELWELGDKLRIDAFVEGSCNKTTEGDVLLNIKVIKHRTAKILWSGDFIAGPNKIKPSIFDLKWTVAAPLRVFPIDEIKDDSVVIAGLVDPKLNQFTFEASVSEAIKENKRMWFSVTAGFTMATLSKEDSKDIGLTSIYIMQLGIDLLIVLIPKTNIDRGYWLGTYMGGKFFKPFSFTGLLPAVSMGYKSQLSRHFGLSVGASYLAGDRIYGGTGTLPGTQGKIIKLSSFSYEFNIINYTF